MIGPGGSLAGIKTETDKIAAVLAEVLKIDSAAAKSYLNSTQGSLQSGIKENDRDNHAYTRAFCLADSPTAGHKADNLTQAIAAGAFAPFVLTSGNNVPGAWAQILGVEDTPVITGDVKFDLHRTLVIGADMDKQIHLIQIACGATGAAALAAGTYSDWMVSPDDNAKNSPGELKLRRCGVGDLIWARLWVPGENNKTFSFYYEMHTYEAA